MSTLTTAGCALAEAITTFVRDFTTHVDGIGDVCSLACFDLHRHGNRKYGSPYHGDKVCARAIRQR